MAARTFLEEARSGRKRGDVPAPLVAKTPLDNGAMGV